MTDTLTIGTTPAEEDCQQVGTPAYDEILAYKECAVFRNQLRRIFGPAPFGAELIITRNPHDFGIYLQVEVRFDEDIKPAVEYALKLEAESPSAWDEEARKELGLTITP